MPIRLLSIPVPCGREAHICAPIDACYRAKAMTVNPELDDPVALREIPLDLSRDSLSERIYAHLRLELLTGLHAPGTKLSIRRLASELNTSPTPVREAIFQLVREGALE